MYREEAKVPKVFIAGGIAVVSILALILVYNLFTVNIDRGHVGVVFAKYGGGTQEAVLDQGVRLVAPWNRVTEFPTAAVNYTMSATHDEGAKKGDDSIPYNTSDGQQGSYDVTLKIAVNGKTAPLFYNVFQGRAFEDVIDQNVRFNLKNAINSNTVDGYQIRDAHLTKRNEIQAKSEARLIEELKQESFKMVNQYRKNRGMELMKDSDYDKFESLFVVYGITINGSRINAAVQERIDAIAKAEAEKTKAEKDLETAKVNAQRQVQEAEAQKLAAEQTAAKKKIEAQGEADALKISSTAQAEANRIISQSLTPSLLSKMAIEKLNPNVQVLDIESTGLKNFFNFGGR